MNELTKIHFKLISKLIFTCQKAKFDRFSAVPCIQSIRSSNFVSVARVYVVSNLNLRTTEEITTAYLKNFVLVVSLKSYLQSLKSLIHIFSTEKVWVQDYGRFIFRSLTFDKKFKECRRTYKKQNFYTRKQYYV